MEKIPCKKCGSGESKVIECIKCGDRYTTYEYRADDGPSLSGELAMTARRLYGGALKLISLLPIDDPFLEGIASARRGDPLRIPLNLVGESSDLFEQGWREGSEVEAGEEQINSERRDSRNISGAKPLELTDSTMGV